MTRSYSNPCPYPRSFGVFAPQRRTLVPRLLLLLSLLVFAAPLFANPVPITTYAQMTARLQADAQKSPLLRVVSLGKSAGGTRDLWMVRLSDPNTDPAQTMRLLVLCRQHGDEPASTEALLRLIHGVAVGGDPALRSELAQVTLYIVPMVNPDGAGAGTRRNANNADLNRDWGRFTQPETREVAAAAKLIRPVLVVDAHNWDGDDEYNADCLEVPRETETAQGRAAHLLQRQALSGLAASGYAVHPTAWGADSDPHLAHRWLTQQNIPSILVETHYGSPADRADFERREGLYTALIHFLAKHYVSPWSKQASAATGEAALFPVPHSAGTPRPAASLPTRSRRWVWVFGLYGLALWGLSLRGREKEQTRPKSPDVRYSCSRKRDKTKTISRSGQRKAISLPPR